MSWNERTTQLLWWIAGLLLVLVVAFVLHAVIGGLVFGVFLYYAVRPIYTRAIRYVGDSDGDVIDDSTVAAASTLLLVSVPMIVVVAFTLYRVIQDVSAFLQANQLTRYQSLLQPYVSIVQATSRGNFLQRLQPGRAGPVDRPAIEVIRPYLNELSRFARRFFAVLVDLFVMLLVAYYLLKFDDEIANWARLTFDDEHSFVTVMERVDAQLEQIYWGNLVTVVVTAAIAGVTYYALQILAPQSITVPYVLLSAMLTGIFTLVPVVGIKLFYFPMTAYLSYRAVSVPAAPLWFPAVFFVVTLVVVDAIPDFFIRSWISSGELNMGLVLVAYVFGSIAFGWYGIFLGPIVLVLFLNFARLILPKLLSGVSVESVLE